MYVCIYVVSSTLFFLAPANKLETGSATVTGKRANPIPREHLGLVYSLTPQLLLKTNTGSRVVMWDGRTIPQEWVPPYRRLIFPTRHALPYMYNAFVVTCACCDIPPSHMETGRLFPAGN